MAKKPDWNVVPDRLDLRDRPYAPAVRRPPPLGLVPKTSVPVLDQKNTSACTGFALATVANLLHRRHRSPRSPLLSPYMLYSMARRYDEFAGSKDTGSSLRGAMKGWYKHGVCRDVLWKTGVKMPPAANTPAKDWWLDAAQRPLGAYFRVDTRSVTDMHVALDEVGVLYASAICHDGWLNPIPAAAGQRGFPTIPAQTAAPDDGGHAFAIVGFDREGFLLQNSWGPGWGKNGIARLRYEDWTENAMDCWVAQLGVPTAQHAEVAAASTLRVEKSHVRLAADPKLRDREISPFVIDLENNGELSHSGLFRTSASDVAALLDFHLEAACKRWNIKPGQSVDVAVYAHGGLTGEEGAADTAAKWIPALYDAQIFPIFLMWETDLWSTIKGRLADLVTGLPRPTAGLVDQLSRFWNTRVERAVGPAGTFLWKEMKQNARLITENAGSGGRILYEKARQHPRFAAGHVRLHLIGHSAGSIVHCEAARTLASIGWSFQSVSFMAPACRVDTFKETLVPMLKAGSLGSVHCFNLTAHAEDHDPTCRPILGYGRSLLHLVSNSFEGGSGPGLGVPILGMQTHFDRLAASLGAKSLVQVLSPGTGTAATTHGGFDDDAATMASVIRVIKAGKA